MTLPARTSPGRAMVGSLADAWRHGTTVERGCYVLAAILAAGGIAHAAVLVATGASWSGPLSLRKPATFGVSFALTLATITWVLAFLPPRRARQRLLVLLAAACALEVVVISVQAWRGLTSHFGVSGPGAGLVGASAAGGAVVLIATLVAATALVCRPLPEVAPSMRLALRAGFASLLVALALGVLMMARGLVLAIGGDVGAAFAFAAGVKPGHAATMHGVLVLPALAWLVSFADRPESWRLAVVRAAALGYVLFAAVVVVEALAAVDPLALATTPVVATVLAAAGGLVLVGAGIVGLRGVARR